MALPPLVPRPPSSSSLPVAGKGRPQPLPRFVPSFSSTTRSALSERFRNNFHRWTSLILLVNCELIAKIQTRILNEGCACCFDDFFFLPSPFRFFFFFLKKSEDIVLRGIKKRMERVWERKGGRLFLKGVMLCLRVLERVSSFKEVIFV